MYRDGASLRIEALRDPVAVRHVHRAIQYLSAIRLHTLGARSALSTRTYCSQVDGAGMSITPPIGFPPAVHIVYGCWPFHTCVPQPATF
jgi:hypothetical protein